MGDIVKNRIQTNTIKPETGNTVTRQQRSVRLIHSNTPVRNL